MRVLFVASEGLPFSKTGGLADVVEALPKALVAQGHEVAVVLPRYRGTKATAVVIPSLTIAMDCTAGAREIIRTTRSGMRSFAARRLRFQNTSGPRMYFIATTGKQRWWRCCCGRLIAM